MTACGSSQGNRHDDITYQSIAKAFGLTLKLHEDAFDRMKRLTKQRPNQPLFSWDVDSPARTARMRMVRLPTDESRDLAAQALFVRDDLWVPIAVINGNIHVLPGVPSLCTLSQPEYRLLGPCIFVKRLADP